MERKIEKPTNKRNNKKKLSNMFEPKQLEASQQNKHKNIIDLLSFSIEPTAYFNSAHCSLWTNLSSLYKSCTYVGLQVQRAYNSYNTLIFNVGEDWRYQFIFFQNCLCKMVLQYFSILVLKLIPVTFFSI